jgi:predicted transcriptional regulator
VKAAFSVARLNTDWLAKRLHLNLPLVQAVLEQVCRDGMLEETMQSSQGKSHYRITQRGRDYGARVLEACGYIGPAPVSMDAY